MNAWSLTLTGSSYDQIVRKAEAEYRSFFAGADPGALTFSIRAITECLVET